MNYMGIDHHKQYSPLNLVDKRGKEIKSGRVENLRREVEEFLNGVEGKIVAAIEA
ncbi:MAG: IS110 family transposase, partial [Candidatus Aminicenantes bacterium]